ncbi:MAG: GNAT family N-acetyltransferase [Burkholderiales bacterium]|nr:GNAT family N-acetyltransferase [Burkholderiales bacterium]
MHIRPARYDDIPRIVALGALMAAESPRWSRLAYSREKVRALAYELVGSAQGYLYVAEDQHLEVVGFMAAMCQEHWCSEDLVIAELALYVEPARRGSSAAARLLQSFKVWAVRRGARMILAGCSTGIGDERAARLYEKVGFRRASIGLELQHV